MRFYTKQHKYYCGIDLHARSMYICILDEEGETVVHRNSKARPEAFLRAIAPYREDVVVAVECMFVWYWLADVCAKEKIPFVLGHALYMKAIHGGKSKNDRIDSHKIAVLLRGGTLPVAYVYPRKMRSTRDLLRRRNHFMRKRSELLTHIQNTNSQYNLPEFEKKIAYKANREALTDQFPDPSVRKSIEVDLELLTVYDRLLSDLECSIEKNAKGHNVHSWYLLRSIPGVGKILSLILLYEIHDIRRFPRVQDFVSYCRLVKCPRESAGKKFGAKNSKIGNHHLKWAFSEAACLFLKGNEQAQHYHGRLVSKHGKGKALSVLAHKIGRAVYFMLKRKEPFSMETFFAHA
ncbi:MAG TPA: IS110 family transposase [Syntrophobacteria bacterium]|nr:IS110 family transposase [Syntrophobacteria bacterium]